MLVSCPRLAGKIDAFMLKILIEQELGYPAELVPDGLSPEIPSNLTGPASVYEALASGAVHMYPEVALFFSAGPLRIPTPEPNAGLAFGRGRVV